MNSRQLVASNLVVAALVLPVAGHAATDADSDRTSPAVFVRDSVITAKIKAKLAEERLANTLKIKVDTNDSGNVTLSGTARTQEEAEQAVSIARGVGGVVSVESYIQVAAER